MFGLDKDPKLQSDKVLTPGDIEAGMIISSDTHRDNRIPPHQSRTKKWPVLDASGPPRIDMDNWSLIVSGLVENSKEFTWEEFQQLPRKSVFADMHCVTRWSRLGNVWEGVCTRDLMELIGVKPSAKFVIAHGYDRGWTTNMPLSEFMGEDCLLADTHDGDNIELEHGGPLRLVIPRLYAWKSAKWLRGLEFVESDRAGYWERNGYHMLGDPWKEQRFREDW